MQDLLMCLAFCKGGTFCLNKAGCKLHFGCLQSRKEQKLSISGQGIISVLKTKKAAFVDPIIERSKLDNQWANEWKSMTATKEEWLDKFVSGVRLYAKHLMAKEEILFSLDSNQSGPGDTSFNGGEEIHTERDKEETALDEAEVNTFLAGQLKAPKTNNKQKQICFILEQEANIQDIDFLPGLPDNKDGAIHMLQSNSDLHQQIMVKQEKQLLKLGSQVRKVGNMIFYV
ncbi:hypothetical protein ACA910_004371 [Epithemia clementina (nom. ined.)]